MNFSFKCHHCLENLEAEESIAGEDMNCPECDNPLTIPQKRSGHYTEPILSMDTSADFSINTGTFPTTAQYAKETTRMILLAGWACFLIGLSLHIMANGTTNTHLPLFIGSVIIGLIIFFQRKSIHGVFLLVATVLAPIVLHSVS